MSLLGVYPFTVYVANVFDPSQNVGINVIHHHHLGYYTEDKENNKKFVIDSLQSNGSIYTIPGGYRLGFPMLMGDEYLEISINNPDNSTLPSEYFILAGATGKCYVDNSLGEPETGTTLKDPPPEDKDDKVFYCGGLWQIVNGTKNWNLTIKKYGEDPATDDVVVGPGTPG